MKRRIRIIGLVIGMLAIPAFAVYAARALRGQDLYRYYTTTALTGISVATFLYALNIPISAWGWRRLLCDLGVKHSWRRLSEILSVTQMAKYLPGNVGQHISRTGMALTSGIPLSPFLTSIIGETVVAVFAAISIGLGGLGCSNVGLHLLRRESAVTIVAAAALAAVPMLLLASARGTIFRVTRRLLPTRLRSGVIMLPHAGALLYAFTAYCGIFIVTGCGLTAMAALLFPASAHDGFLLTGSFALAWIVGFFTPGAPAGLGVREGVMLTMLQANYSKPDALILLIGFRVATTAGDALCFLAGLAAMFLFRGRVK